MESTQIEGRSSVVIPGVSRLPVHQVKDLLVEVFLFSSLVFQNNPQHKYSDFPSLEI